MHGASTRATGRSARFLLLELGTYVHPVVAPVFVDAVGGREKRLHPYALKALMALEPDVCCAPS